MSEKNELLRVLLLELELPLLWRFSSVRWIFKQRNPETLSWPDFKKFTIDNKIQSWKKKKKKKKKKKGGTVIFEGCYCYCTKCTIIFLIS